MITRFIFTLFISLLFFICMGFIMKQFKFYRSLFYSIAFLLVFSIFFYFASHFLSLGSFIITPINSVVSKVDKVINVPFSYVSSLSSDLKDLFTTYSENEVLKSKIYDLENQEEKLNMLEEENDALKAEIATSSTFKDSVSLIGEVIVRSPFSWYDSLVVGLGTDHGVKDGMLVLNGGGLIGKVSSSSKSSSHVELLTDGNNFDIPVKISLENSVVYGLLSAYDSDSKEFIVTDLNVSKDIVVDSVVSTSGLDGISASNVLVGKVSRIEDGEDRKLFITPAASFEAISFVTIVGD